MDDIRLELDKIFHSLSFSHDAFAFPHARPAGPLEKKQPQSLGENG